MIDPTSTPAVKRPLGLAAIGIVWGITGLFNLFASISNILGDYGAIPNLSNPTVDRWYRFGVPVDLMFNVALFVFAAFQFVTILGLWTRRPWSFKLALLMPILIAAIYTASIALYYSAPASLDLASGAPVLATVAGFFWIYVFWVYLKRPRVKEFLRIEEPLPAA